MGQDVVLGSMWCGAGGGLGQEVALHERVFSGTLSRTLG